MLLDRVCEGWVVHRREAPTRHTFRYPVWMLYADVDRLQGLSGRWFSASSRPAPLSLRPGDFPRDPASKAAGGVRAGINARLAREGHLPAERVFLLAQPRSWGWLFNPVSFYFCYRRGRLHCVLAEITNTPWDEVHTYVLEPHTDRDELEFAFPKRFHVSPFQPMDLEYRWRFKLDGAGIHVAMRLVREGEDRFFAGLYLRTAPVTGAALRRGALRYPAQNLRTMARIYWQALRLWAKRAPFHSHPNPTSEVNQP